MTARARVWRDVLWQWRCNRCGYGGRSPRWQLTLAAAQRHLHNYHGHTS